MNKEETNIHVWLPRKNGISDDPSKYITNKMKPRVRKRYLFFIYFVYMLYCCMCYRFIQGVITRGECEKSRFTTSSLEQAASRIRLLCRKTWHYTTVRNHKPSLT
jgi:hypothetical protein